MVLLDASENHDPNRAGTVPWSSQGGAQLQGGESVDPGLLWDLRQLLMVQDLSGSRGQTSWPAERVLFEYEGRQGLGVFAVLVTCEAESVGPAGTEDRSGTEPGDTAGAGNRAESGCKAETEAAAAAAGPGDSVPTVWAVLLQQAVLAEVGAAEVGQWVWLGGTESESAVGSWSEAWSYQCQELSASDNSDTTTPEPGEREQTGSMLNSVRATGTHIYSILSKIFKTVP